MSGDDVIASIEGTATFNHVIIYREGEMVRLAGTYSEESETVYEGPPGCIFIEGMQMVVGDSEAVTLEANEGEWIWVEATEDELRITSEKRS